MLSGIYLNMNDNEELIRRIGFENFIWITFIIVSIINIYGDELIKKSVRENDSEVKKKAENLFLFISLISVLIYVYFFYRNYTDYQKYCNRYYESRLFGSILILIGTLCLVYFQLYNSKELELASNI